MDTINVEIPVKSFFKILKPRLVLGPELRSPFEQSSCAVLPEASLYWWDDVSSLSTAFASWMEACCRRSLSYRSTLSPDAWALPDIAAGEE